MLDPLRDPLKGKAVVPQKYVEALERQGWVKVIRCKDCRHYNTNYCGDGFGWCERKGIGHGTSDDWFCADGERADAPPCGSDYCEIDKTDGGSNV